LTFSCGCGAGPTANLSRGLAGECRGAGQMHDMLHSTSALLRPGTQSRPQVVQLVPSPHPLTPQRGDTCIPVGPHCL